MEGPDFAECHKPVVKTIDGGMYVEGWDFNFPGLHTKYIRER